MPVLSTRNKATRQPRGGTALSALGQALQPSVALAFGDGIRPLNAGVVAASETWTAIGTGTLLDAVPTDGGYGLRDLAQAGGVRYGADLEFGRPVSTEACWFLLQFTHSPYFNAGSSVNTIGVYGSGGNGLDGGALVHLTTTNNIRAWLMSVDVTTSFAAVEGQAYTVLLCRDQSRNGHVWVDGVGIGGGTCSTAQFPGNSRLSLLSDDGLNERRARPAVSIVAWGLGDVTAFAASLSLQPWQLFAAPSLWSVAAPPTTPTLRNLTAADITATSARLRMDVEF